MRESVDTEVRALGDAGRRAAGVGDTEGQADFYDRVVEEELASDCAAVLVESEAAYGG
ncbi:hypothetical protein OG241_10190 [Streptomyces sp. NBC_01390]|uniref:hypothetical protein n=1 Tax=Streptomyces sp. NBC_01390 TaxID=2903850 RepID=UPI0032510B0B